MDRALDTDPAVQTMPSFDRPARQVGYPVEELGKTVRVRRRGEDV
jgi:hypothetical protein